MPTHPSRRTAPSAKTRDGANTPAHPPGGLPWDTATAGVGVADLDCARVSPRRLIDTGGQWGRRTDE